MLLKVFKSKLHRATVTEANLQYEGSIAIDTDLMKAANLHKYEAVWVWNTNNGERLMTYILEGGPGVISLNGAAARLCQPGDIVIITSFTDITPEELETFKPTVVLLGANNKIKSVVDKSGHEFSET